MKLATLTLSLSVTALIIIGILFALRIRDNIRDRKKRMVDHKNGNS